MHTHRTPDTIHVWSLSSDPEPLLRAYNLKVQNVANDLKTTSRYNSATRCVQFENNIMMQTLGSKYN